MDLSARHMIRDDEASEAKIRANIAGFGAGAQDCGAQRGKRCLLLHTLLQIAESYVIGMPRNAVPGTKDVNFLPLHRFCPFRSRLAKIRLFSSQPGLLGGSENATEQRFGAAAVPEGERRPRQVQMAVRSSPPAKPFRNASAPVA
jgi:hypothetical protein